MSFKTLVLALTLGVFMAVHVATLVKLKAADTAEPTVTYVHGAD